MYKKVINYVNFNGEQKSKECYFNLTRPEMMEMKRSPLFEMQAIIERIRGMKDPDNELTMEEKDMIQEKMGKILRDLVVMSYGEKSADGERFIKRVGTDPFGKGQEFIETNAYDELYMEMLQDIRGLIGFVRAVIPESLSTQLDNDPELQRELKELETSSIE